MYMYTTAFTSTNTSPLDTEDWKLLETTTVFEETTDFYNGTTSSYDQTTGCYKYSNEDYAYGFSTVGFYLLIAVHFLSTMAVMYGVVTCIVFPKARNFQNYVSLNALICLTFNYSGRSTLTFLNFYLGSFFYVSFNCWLLVGSVMIYRKIVVVFNATINRKYLVSSVFAWGLAFCSLVCFYWQAEKMKIMCVILSVMLALANVFLYGRVVYCLFNGTGVREPSRKWRDIQIATITFFLGGTPMTLLYAFSKLAPNKCIKFNVMLDLTVNFVYSILYIMLRTNWHLWYEALAKSSLGKFLCCKKSLEQGWLNPVTRAMMRPAKEFEFAHQHFDASEALEGKHST